MLPCNLSLIACFADINVSQGSVATHAWGSVIVVELCCVVILKVTRNRRKYRVR